MITKKNDFCVVYDDFSTTHAAFIFLLITVFYSEVPDNVIFSRNICWRKSVVSLRLLQSFRQLLPKNNIGSVLEKYIFFATWESNRFLLSLNKALWEKGCFVKNLFFVNLTGQLDFLNFEENPRKGVIELIFCQVAHCRSSNLAVVWKKLVWKISTKLEENLSRAFFLSKVSGFQRVTSFSNVFQY